MGRYCSAFGCKNNNRKRSCKEKRISFHSYPLQDPDRLRKWLSNLGRKDLVPTTYSAVCSEHFRECDFIYQTFTKTRLLKKTAVPIKVSETAKAASSMPTPGPRMESKARTQIENKQRTQMENKYRVQNENKHKSQMDNKHRTQVDNKHRTQVDNKHRTQVDNKHRAQMVNKRKTQIENKNKTQMHQVKKFKSFIGSREKRCNKCGFITFSICVLYNHKYRCKGQLLGKSLCCSYCKRKFNFLNLYKGHKRFCVKKVTRNYFLQNKQEEDNNLNNKRTPKSVSTNEYSFSCPICHASFKSKLEFVNHLKQQSCSMEQTVKKKSSFSARKSFSSPKHSRIPDAYNKKNNSSKLKNELQGSTSNKHRCLWCKSVYPSEKLLYMHFEMNDQCAIAYYQKHCLGMNQKLTSKARKSISVKAKKSFPSKRFITSEVSRSSSKFKIRSKTARKTLVSPPRRKEYSKSDKSISKSNLNQCPVCFEDFPDTFTFYQHQKATNHWGKATKTISSTCRCPFCEKEFLHIKSRNAHVRNHSDRSAREIKAYLISVTCNFCSQIFASDSAKLQHMIIKHRENSASFIRSNTESENEESDKNKMSSVPSSVKKKLRQQPNLCPVCSKSFSHTVLRNKHFNEVHLKIFECQYCNTKFKSSSSLSNHIQLSHSKNLNCKGCKASFSNEIELLQHILKYHSDQDPKLLLPSKPVKTTLSEEKFQDMPDVPRLKHSEDIRFRNNSLGKNIEFYCDVCDIGYQKLCGLQRHRQSKLHKDTLEKNIDAFHKSLSELPSTSPSPVPRVVKQPEILTCSDCSDEFTNIKDFVPHRLSHFSVQSKYLKINELNPYMCEICSDVMDSHSKVQLHLFWHLQVESTSNKNSLIPNKNDTIVPDRLSGQHVAKKSFSKPGNEPLQEVVIGGVSKPLFTCEACNIGFPTKIHYNIHVRKLCKKIKSAKLLAKYSSMKNDVDNESLGASESGVVHCRKCNFLLSSEAKFEQHKEFCKECEFDTDPEEILINADVVKSALGLDTAVAGCVTCAALFDDISSIEGHLMTHQTGEVTEEVPDVLHCAFCNCLFSLDAFKVHKDFCKIHVNIGRKVTKSKHLDVLKSALELKCAVAACISCGLHFDDLETFSEHLMLHQTKQIQNDPIDKKMCNGETSEIDKNIEDDNSHMKSSADILTGDSVDDTDLNDQDRPEPALDSMSGYSSDYSVDTENKKSSLQVEVGNDKNTDAIVELRENFSQLLCLLISDNELMQKLGYGKLDVDDVLVNVLQQMGQKPHTENASKIDLFRKNIKMLLNLCLKDQFLKAIGKGKTADEMVIEALNIFANEDMEFESD